MFYISQFFQIPVQVNEKARFNQTGDLFSEYMYQIIQNIVL